MASPEHLKKKQFKPPTNDTNIKKLWPQIDENKLELF
jgi:hypothetical protein